MGEKILMWALKHPVWTGLIVLTGIGGSVALGREAIRAADHVGCAAASAIGAASASIGTAAITLTDKAVDNGYGIHMAEDGFTLCPQSSECLESET